MDGRPRILGVDDSLTIRKALEIVLKPAGYDLELAASGSEAIDKAKANQPRLILLDFVLPDMAGTDVCRRLAADPETAHIPVVLISAKGAEIRQAYRDIGNVVSYITKPFKPQAITAVVEEALAKTAGALIKLSVPTEGEAAIPPPASLMAPGFRSATIAPPSFVPFELSGSGNGNGHELAAGNGHAETDDAEFEEASETESVDSGVSASARRELLESMFETLRSGLEGVYVEEVDTPAGAAADQAKTYTDLIEQLSRELDETLRHARSGARYTLYGDGSVRALDETLLDVFRRSCRLLFRAAVSGAVSNDTTPDRRRFLVACHRESAVHEQLGSMLAAHPDWQIFTISEGFRQLPMMTRLYGPTHIIAETTGSGALWDQLRVLQRMPEAHAMRVLGLADPARLAVLESVDGEHLAERGIGRIFTSAFDLEKELSDGTDEREPPRASAREDSTAAAAQ